VDEWMGLFDDPLLANSLLDRLTHNAHVIVIEGESYRKRMGLKRTDRKGIDYVKEDVLKTEDGMRAWVNW